MHFQKSWTLVRRTKRGKSQQTNIQLEDRRDSCAQNKTSEILTNALSEFLGLRFAEQNDGNLKKMSFRKFWDSGSGRGPKAGQAEAQAGPGPKPPCFLAGCDGNLGGVRAHFDCDNTWFSHN